MVGREDAITDVAEFQDGSLLKELEEKLSGVSAPYSLQKGSNKHTFIGNIKNALDFIANQGVRVTCAPAGMPV